MSVQEPDVNRAVLYLRRLSRPVEGISFEDCASILHVLNIENKALREQAEKNMRLLYDLEKKLERQANQLDVVPRIIEAYEAALKKLPNEAVYDRIDPQLVKLAREAVREFEQEQEK